MIVYLTDDIHSAWEDKKQTGNSHQGSTYAGSRINLLSIIALVELSDWSQINNELFVISCFEFIK